MSGVAPLRLIWPPVSVAFPSSKTRPEESCVPLTVTVNGPLASLPAAKSAVNPLAHVPMVPPAPPVESSFQLVSEADQVPSGVVPAPAVVPFISQYKPAPDAGAAHASIAGVASTAAERMRVEVLRRLAFPPRCCDLITVSLPPPE